ncbi:MULTISPECIES: ubiquitin-like small modifier protein 1 [unclassified Candidatus Frackibacter]|uniref:ubiquitin-like small modifier protein 1 n=1 Tax=unclassified Candidatus Frackibacter TaxID=2648818 RepID=UPI0008810F27|nr:MULTISPECIES: ubiquitin-like small modifier protein 1 [unclassified Candidatus Frackibacter]SDC78725.1 molybdopterin synthase sulfur carrier subunit [Candidatus Frackibacter sp. WG11]SEM91514.1 molybdopterin synthase sulfur carrier subunit [Candidatus Frackibacter sp. WG12]SFM01319.1 molybdopterin synthase sulfur carrier subunit [Candidatus Frackibacter sp. WG13]
MKVKLLATLRNITDCNELELEVENIQEVVEKLIELYGEEMKTELLESDQLDETITILVNGRNMLYLNGLKTKLKRNDIVTIFPQVAGG